MSDVNITGLSGIEAQLLLWSEGIKAALKAACEEICVLLANYAKQNHHWQDRTGNTNNSTGCAISEANDEHIVVTLFAGMDYDIFLELARGGKWAWLWPAIVANLDRITQILEAYGLRNPMDAANVFDSVSEALESKMTDDMSSVRDATAQDVT